MSLLDAWVPGEGFYFEHPGRTIVGIGARETLTIPAGPGLVARAAEVAERAARSHGSIVVGALPFGEHVPATLTIPAEVRHVEGRGEPRPAPDDDASPLRVTAVPDPAAYVEAVEKVRARIRAGDLDKAVLARMLVAQADHVFDRRALLARLRAAEPDAFIFAAQGFIGASPELLVSRAGRQVRAVPLAGTAPRAQPRDALLSSVKDRAEHAFVVDAVRAALAPACDDLAVPTPHVVSTSTVWHLATEVTGTLSEPPPTSLALAARLHPTPAVCGTPTARAAAVISEVEEIDRALYAGLVGWMGPDGDGEWAIVLRCAEVAGRIALLFAGAGIVADSDPASELAETEVKFRSMLEALGYA